MADEIGKAMQKVGGTAGELKVPFEQVSSWIAVISSKTRLSAETIGDSIKSVLARMQSLKQNGFDSTDGTTVNNVAKSLNAVGIQLVDQQGNFRNFGKVMDELGAKWDTLTGRQKSYLATTVAGTYQQSNFLTLMNGYKQSTDLYAKALDSAGTAQAKFNLYQQGTEAQLNRLKDSWDAMWMSAFKSSDIQSFVGSLSGIVNALTSVVSHVGALPTALGLLAEGFLLFNTKARTAVNDVVYSITTAVKEFGLLNTTLLTEQESFILSSNSTGILSKAMLNMTLVARGTGIAIDFIGASLKKAFLTFVPSLIPVALIMGIGYAIEKITEAIQNQREEEAKLKEEQNQLVSSYSSHKKAITDLTAEYEKLSQAKQSNNGKLNTADEKKYVDVQNQLAKLLPSVKEGIDSKGNAILKSSDAIRDQIKLLEKQVELEKEQQSLQAPKSLADNSNTLSGLQNDESKNQKTEDYYKGIVDQLEKAKTNHAQILYYQGLENDANLKKLNDENQANSLLQKNAELIKNYFDGSKINPDSITGISSVLTEISTKGKDMGQVDLLFKSISDSINKLNSALQSGNGKAINNAILGLESLGVKGEKLKEILTILEGQQNKTAKSTDDSINSTKSATQAQTDYSASLQKTIADELSKASADEQIVGMTQNRIDQAKDEIAIYNLMSGVENRSAEQTKALADAKQYLASIYPNLVQGANLNIEAMTKETEQNDILLKALKDVTDGKANAEEIQTTNAALGARARLQIMDAELQALQQLEQTYADSMQHQMDMAQQLAASNFGGSDEAYLAAQKMHNAQQATANDIKNTKDQINSLIPSYDGIFKKLADYTSYQGTYYKGTTQSNTATTDSIYVTDKYKQKMDALNTSIAQQNALLSKYPNYSSDYQKALKAEIDLLQQQKKLTDDQANSLAKQINNGKITDPIITSNNSSSSASSVTATGNSTQDKIWNFLKGNGFSDSAAAGVMGNLQQESGFNTSITNGIGAYGLAQWLGGRKTALKNYANNQGTSSSDLQTQLEFMLKEMGNGELSNLSSFKQTGNASEAARIFEAQFERSGGSAVGTREAYANQIYNKFKGTQGSSSSGNGSSTTSNSSNNKKNIDDAITELNNLKSTSINIQTQIQQLFDTLITSTEAPWERKIAGFDQQLTDSQNKMATYTEGSKKWNAEVNTEISLLNKKKSANQSEINDLEKLSKTKGLTSNQKSQIDDEVAKLKANIKDTQKNIDDLSWQKAQASITNYDKAVDVLNSKLQLSKDKMASYAEGSSNWFKELKNQVSDVSGEITDYANKIAEIQKQLKSKGLTEAHKDELTKELADANDQLQQAKNNLTGLQQQYKDFITNTLTKEKEDNLKHLQDGFDKLDKQLEGLVKKDSSFDFGNFSDSIDNITNTLNELDGNFSSNAFFDTSTWDVRNDIADTEKNISDLSQAVDKLTNSTSDTQSGLESIIRSESDQANQIHDQITSMDNQIRDTTLLYKEQEDSLQNQIDLKQQQLDQLDQQYQMEDRIKALNDLMNQRDQAMADKRFEVIDANGNKSLTYDKAKVNDLNKQIDDMNTQNARDDAKKALQDQITAMQTNLDKTKQIHQANLQEMQLYRDSLQNLYDQLNTDISNKMSDLKTLQDKQIADTTKQWDDLITAVTSGTTTYSSLMSGWYKTTITDMTSYNTDIGNQLAQLKQSYADMKTVTDDMSKLGANTSTPKSYTVSWTDPKTKKTVSKSVKTLADAQSLITTNKNYSPQIVPVYHEGGIIGSVSSNSNLVNLANNLFNIKPNEQIVKALKGELMVPPKNIPNFFTNIGNMINSLMSNNPAVVATGDTIHLHNVTIKTENASTFLPDLQRIINTRKS